MPSEPLDPCPVCGKPVSIDALSRSDAPGREAVLCGPPTHTQESPCLYYNLVADHRRLCAEVALARVVMEHDKKTAKVCEHYPGTCELCDEVYAAIARVREASR